MYSYIHKAPYIDAFCIKMFYSSYFDSRYYQYGSYLRYCQLQNLLTLERIMNLWSFGYVNRPKGAELGGPKANLGSPECPKGL